MPKPTMNLRRRGKRWYFRKMIKGKEVEMPLGPDERVARQRCRKLRNSDLHISSVTVAELVKRWLKVYIATARNEEGQKKAEQRARDYIVHFLGLKPMSSVRGDDLRAFRLWLDEQPLSPQTVKHVLSDARCLFRWAEGEGYISKSPFPRNLMPKIPEVPPDRLFDDELAILTSLDEPYGFVIRFGLLTGLRWGEMVRAEWQHVDGSKLLVPKTKNTKLRRVPILPALAAELRTRDGRFIPFRNSGSFNLKVRKLSGVERFHVHQLRHSFACRWLEGGGSQAALQAILGHSSPLVTQRYGRLSDAHVMAEAQRIGGKLGKFSGSRNNNLRDDNELAN